MTELEIFAKMLKNRDKVNSGTRIFDREAKDYYIYAYYKPGVELPFYIGKGKDYRLRDHLTPQYLLKNTTLFYNTLKKMLRENIQSIIKKLHENLTEEEAFKLEEQLIRHYGRIDLGTGCLTNHTYGGDGSSGRVTTEETRRKMSLSARTKEEVSDDTRIKRSRNASMQRDTLETKLKKSKIAAELRGRPIESYDLQTGKIVKQYDAVSQVKWDGFCRNHVRQCLEGRLKDYAGLGWRDATSLPQDEVKYA